MAVQTGSFSTSGQSPGTQVQRGFNISLYGTFSASVCPERSFDGGSSWQPVTFPDGIPIVWTAPASVALDEPESGVLWRLNCVSLASGTVNYRVSQSTAGAALRAGQLTRAATATSTFLAAAGGVKMDGVTVLLVDNNSTGSVKIGQHTGENTTSNTLENVFIGNYAAQYVTNSGSGLVAVGQHAMGYETGAGNTVAIGNDCMRNTRGVSSAVAVGNRAFEYGASIANTAVGMLALSGNSANILIGGTKTPGDVLTFTATCPTLNGGLQMTATYTVAGGDMTTVTAGFAAAIHAVVNTATGQGLGDFAAAVSNTNAQAIFLMFPGTYLTGGFVTSMAVTVSGGATVTAVLSEGLVGASNVAIGKSAMQGRSMTSSAASNVAVGTDSMPNLTTGSTNVAIGTAALNTLSSGGSNVAVGASAMMAATTSINSTAVGQASGLAVTTAGSGTYIGQNSGQRVTTGGLNTFLGANSGSKITTGTSNICIGVSSGSTILQTGSNNICIGVNTDVLASSDSNRLRIGLGSSSVMALQATSLSTTPRVIAPGFFGKGVTVGVTAHAGGGIGSATLITTSNTRVDTVATAGDSIQLGGGWAAEEVGTELWIHNRGVNALQFFANGMTINDIAGSTGIPIPAGKMWLGYISSTSALYGSTLT